MKHLHSAYRFTSIPPLPFTPNISSITTSRSSKTTFINATNSDSLRFEEETKHSLPELTSSCISCSCTSRRRQFVATVGTALFPVYPSNASISLPDDDPMPMAMLNRVHPPRPDWYEEFYASAMDKSMRSYEAEIAGYKSQLFAKLRGNAKKILEIGIGTGPNLKYYGVDNDLTVFGVDPNRKMEKYAKVAAEAAGLASTNFKFIQAVAEALPLGDASMDAVVGTLVLCSVQDVDKTLRDGSLLRFVQGVLDPLQQTIADGCHLTRKTGNNISAAGFSSVDINSAFLSAASLINPHAYGIAYK